MSSQLSYRLHGREQRPNTLRKHYRDGLDTGQVKASAKEPRACSARRLVMGRSSFLRAPLRPVQGHYAGGRSQVATTISDQTFLPFECLLVHQLMSALGPGLKRLILLSISAYWV
jgi:hypothetical protein